MNCTSFSDGDGLSVRSHLVSVVPAMVAPCHGKKKITRPSLVAGSSSPILSGLEEKKEKFTILQYMLITYGEHLHSPVIVR